jgi:hypothetical protein
MPVFRKDQLKQKDSAHLIQPKAESNSGVYKPKYNFTTWICDPFSRGGGATASALIRVRKDRLVNTFGH